MHAMPRYAPAKSLTPFLGSVIAFYVCIKGIISIDITQWMPCMMKWDEMGGQSIDLRDYRSSDPLIALFPSIKGMNERKILMTLRYRLDTALQLCSTGSASQLTALHNTALNI